ncbi:dnaJ homolog subfamily C member 2 [Ciona intestinalis]
MSRSKYKNWIVAISYGYPGVVGNFINQYLIRKRVRLRRIVEKQKALGRIKDEDLVLVEYPDIKSLDPKHWKDQDHYAVLGLPKLRHRSTPEQIKFAYRKMVLKHHPDKRRRAGEKLGRDADDYFTCITRAYEILGSLESRRSYDSIDPNFEDYIPPNNKSSRENFFKVYGDVFEQNMRWSLDPDVPFLGDKWSTIEEVDTFYNFWYNFNSWREYSYLDEENKEKAEDAYERRWMEKQNRAARATRKKEENQRIRQLVDNAYACDPRVKQYKEDEKKKKEMEKNARANAIKKANEEKLAAEAEKQKKLKDEERKLEEERVRKQTEAKKEKEREKKMLKKERQKLKGYCKNQNFFRDSEKERLNMMEQIDHLCVEVNLISLQELNKSISDAESTESAKNIIEQKLHQLRQQVQQEKQKHLEAASKSKINAVNGSSGGKEKAWSYSDIKVLIKAVNLFPAGTNDRWEVVANYINTHSSMKGRSGKECLARAKNLKESELKAEVNQKAFEKFQEKHLNEAGKKNGTTDSDITKRLDGPRPWTGEEQKRLEQALKTYPSSTPQRWDRISEAVMERTKKECMIRYKELVEMVKAKKAINKPSKT